LTFFGLIEFICASKQVILLYYPDTQQRVGEYERLNDVQERVSSYFLNNKNNVFSLLVRFKRVPLFKMDFKSMPARYCVKALNKKLRVITIFGN
jgi:hypothetical protein